ncbi:MAG: hypothetical protein ACK4F7_05375 [Inhella sp.]
MHQYDGGSHILRGNHFSPRAGLGAMSQGRETFDRLTVREHLLMGLASRPLSTPLACASGCP